MKTKYFHAFLLISICIAAYALLADTPPITITKKPDPHTPRIEMQNITPDDYEIELSLKDRSNIDCGVPWPYRQTIWAKRTIILTCGLNSSSRPYSLEWKARARKAGTTSWLSWDSSNPDSAVVVSDATPTSQTTNSHNTQNQTQDSGLLQAMADRDAMLKGAYAFPYSHGVANAMTNGPMGFGWHHDQYAYDWPMPIGRNVCAARSGVVEMIKSDSSSGGPTQDYLNDANYVIIKHSDGSYGNYLHLSYNSVTVRPGQSVAAGMLIGKSGNTGWTTQAHLHFHVSDRSGRTFPVQFLDKDKAVSLEVEKSYTGFQPWNYGTATLPGDCVVCTCRTGRYDRINCVIKTIKDLGLQGSATTYWYDGHYGNLYKTPPCNEGKSDGANCIVATSAKLDNLPLGRANYWYDPKYGAVYSHATCTE